MYCKKQFAIVVFSDILVALWHSSKTARAQWRQPHKAFSLAMKWKAGAC
jgi:hypothetical protein